MSVAAAELPVMSGTATSRGGAALSRPAERWPAADRFLRRAVGGGVSGAGRCRRRRAAPDRALRARGRGARLGHARWLRCRAACVDAWPSVLLDLLRAERHENAAEIRLVQVAVATVLGYLLAFQAARPPRRASSLERGRPDAGGRRRRLGGDVALAPLAQRAHRCRLVCRPAMSSRCGVARQGEPPWHGASS